MQFWQLVLPTPPKAAIWLEKMGDGSSVVLAAEPFPHVNASKDLLQVLNEAGGETSDGRAHG